MAPFPFDLDAHAMPDSARLALTPSEKSVIRLNYIADYAALAERLCTDSLTLAFQPRAAQDPLELRPTENDAMTAIQTSKQHHTRLREFGMQVPEAHHVITRNPDVPEKILIYGVTSYLEGITRLDRLEGSSAYPVDAATYQVAQPLLSYYEWVLSSRQTYFLRDLIWSRDRYPERGEQYSVLKDGETLVLHDIEAHVEPAFSVLGLNALKRDIFSLGEMIHRLGEYGQSHETTNEMMERCSSLHDKVNVSLALQPLSSLK